MLRNHKKYKKKYYLYKYKYTVTNAFDLSSTWHKTRYDLYGKITE